MAFATISDALRELRRGAMIIVADDEDRENESDLTMAADGVSPQALNFMLTHARGLICVPMERSRLDDLGIPPMPSNASDPSGPAFAVSVEARGRVTTGISASDRCATIRALADRTSQSGDFIYPGHTFPLRAHPGGVLCRAGHTEAAVALARYAGCTPAGVVCEILDAEGTPMRRRSLERFGRAHALLTASIADLQLFARRSAPIYRKVAAQAAGK
ncbi:MAG TPA: 3,4-dihydroxy-2-butanone-4-phosphate synthase [Candidatus Eremiobacteraceae bacterium]